MNVSDNFDCIEFFMTSHQHNYNHKPVAHIQTQIQPLCHNEVADIVIQTPTLNPRTITEPSQVVGQPSSNIASQSGTCSNASKKKKKSSRGPSLTSSPYSRLYGELDNTTFPETAKDDIIEMKRKHFLPNKENDEALLQCLDARLDETQWQALVKTGRNGFRVIKNELKSQGLSASRLNVFSKSRTGKDRVILDEEIMTILLLIKDRIAQVPEEDCTEAIKEQIFKEFMGEDNHCYTLCRKNLIIPQDVQQIIQMVREELYADEQEEFKETLKREARAEARAASEFSFRRLDE
ncbi:hypothetical protein M9H77_30166 [Catharanthus roseus]|uniref:Uncharacterized protein n=1 Tax=Catharanthus roseus TaxID=4058 RepID=A0ACB9ZYG8_CATRO|nr:hypothetical protein M9H77_30166 [Catharanthus roseus]